jgi:NADH:quinone reductase (non-electrogenic)
MRSLKLRPADRGRREETCLSDLVVALTCPDGPPLRSCFEILDTARIVVVGGGFAGFWAAVAARRAASSRVSVTLVSREPVLQIRPRLYETDPHVLAVDLLRLLDRVGVQFAAGDVATLDVSNRSVRLRGRDSISYARLVVATGSTMHRPKVPGAALAYSIDTQHDAIVFDQRLGAIVRSSPQPTIAIVGAGFTGIELALELRDRIARRGTALQAERARIVLIDRAGVVGRQLGPGPRPVIEAALAAGKVELLLTKTITALSPTRVVFADGALDCDAVVLTTGMVAAAFAEKVPGAHDELGRIVVDRSLRAISAGDIFIAGDAAAADVGDGHLALQSCQHALQLGRFAGENAARDLLGLPLVKYMQPSYITCLDLGRSGAVFTRGWDRVVERTGSEAKAIKRRINTEVIYPPRDGTREELLKLSSLDPSDQRLVRRAEV